MTQIPLSTLFTGLTIDPVILTGLLAFAVLAMAAIAWLTAEPVSSADAAGTDCNRPSGLRRLVTGTAG